MSRIRSVHPSLFTDEDFVALSDAAQIFFIGLWTEADDFGAFEWKPLTLKMKLRPASTEPVEPLLAELQAADRIRKYEIGGRHYGVIRNFCRYQRPKFPKAQHAIPVDFRNFIGSTDPPTEIPSHDDASFPRKAEIAPQMERRMEDGEEDVASLSDESSEGARATARGSGLSSHEGQEIPRSWLTAAAKERGNAGLPPVDLPHEWAKLRRRAGGPIKRSRWIEWAMKAKAGAEKSASDDELPDEADRWPSRLRSWASSGFWLPTFGPKPDEPGCWAPPDLVANAVASRRSGAAHAAA